MESHPETLEPIIKLGQFMKWQKGKTKQIRIEVKNMPK